MNAICPNCEKVARVERVREREIVEVRGEPIEVDAEYHRCLECGVEFENTRGADSIAKAYEIYRRKHNMLQPTEIRQLRKRYGLTQKELARLLGWGDVTLSRYENGALHSEAHEKILRLAMEPQNLASLVEESSEALAEERREQLLRHLRAAICDSFSFERLIEEHVRHHFPDHLTGFRKLDTQKLFNAILFFCLGGQLKTKLNKLLFYADFKHFKEHAVSITGARYIHLQYGPVPDDYDYFFAELERAGSLLVTEAILGQFTGFKCETRTEPEMRIFAVTECETLKQIKSHFRDFGSARIKKASHEEVGYKSTSEGEPISYLFAKELTI